MLLNEIPCLDKGYVAYIDSSGNSQKLRELSLHFLKSPDFNALLPVANVTLAIKCPLFVQLNLSKFDLTMINAGASQQVEAYVPNVGEIGSPDLETNQAISDDMMRTSEALMINPKAYAADGCDRFISQVLTPINTYTTLIVHGSYNEWQKFCDQGNLPAPIKSYSEAVKQILSMEWK